MAKKQKVKYEVVEDFRDLQDENKVYLKGDTFPRPANKKVDEDRINELLGKKNRMKKPVIKKVTETE